MLVGIPQIKWPHFKVPAWSTVVWGILLLFRSLSLLFLFLSSSPLMKYSLVLLAYICFTWGSQGASFFLSFLPTHHDDGMVSFAAALRDFCFTQCKDVHLWYICVSSGALGQTIVGEGGSGIVGLLQSWAFDYQFYKDSVRFSVEPWPLIIISFQNLNLHLLQFAVQPHNNSTSPVRLQEGNSRLPCDWRCSAQGKARSWRPCAAAICRHSHRGGLQSSQHHQPHSRQGNSGQVSPSH